MYLMKPHFKICLNGSDNIVNQKQICIKLFHSLYYANFSKILISKDHQLN